MLCVMMLLYPFHSDVMFRSKVGDLEWLSCAICCFAFKLFLRFSQNYRHNMSSWCRWIVIERFFEREVVPTTQGLLQKRGVAKTSL